MILKERALSPKLIVVLFTNVKDQLVNTQVLKTQVEDLDAVFILSSW